MSKRIFIDGSINSELCIIAADGQEINYFDYSDDLATNKKNNIYLGTVSRVEPSFKQLLLNLDQKRKLFYLLMKFIQVTLKYLIMKK